MNYNEKNKENLIKFCSTLAEKLKEGTLDKDIEFDLGELYLKFCFIEESRSESYTTGALEESRGESYTTGALEKEEEKITTPLPLGQNSINNEETMKWLILGWYAYQMLDRTN